MTYVIGLDPGKATGIAVYDLDTCKPVHMEETPNGILGFRQPFTMNYIAYGSGSAIACERFDLRSTNEFTANLMGVEIIGWLKGCSYVEGWPMPSQHMTLTRLRKNKDKYQDSVVTKLMKEAGFKIGKGHTRMGLSVAMWYAAKVLNHRPTLELLKPKDEK